MNKQQALMRIKQAGILDSLTNMAPEGLGGLVGAGSAMGLSSGMGMGNKGQLISAAIGATIGAMAANKMKEHEQAQMQGIDSNSNLAIQNALMNLDQQAAMTGIDPYANMGMDPSMMGMGPGMGMGMGQPGMGPGMGPGNGMMDGSGMEAMMGGMPTDPYGNAMAPGQPVSGVPDAMQAMQQPKQASVQLTKIASDLVDQYFS